MGTRGMGNNAVADNVERAIGKQEPSWRRQIAQTLAKPPSHLALAALSFTPIRHLVFPISVAALERTPTGRVPSRRLLRALWLGWGNIYAPSIDYLEKMIELIYTTHEGGIVECGSGLTTFILGHLTAASKHQICSLEHDERWFHNIIHRLERYPARGSFVHWTPLRDYDHFCWYDVESVMLPEQIGLVICDGPPWYSRASRYGALPVLRSRLSDECIILLDDVYPAERALLDSWRQEYGASYTIIQGAAPFAVVRLGGV